MSRAPNFSNSEKVHLLRMIANKYSDVLEDKKTNRASTAQKNETWQEIESAFNATSSCSTYRNAASLKKCYENRKKELRKALAEERKETMVTGGSSLPKRTRFDESADILMGIVNSKILVGLDNPYDDDATEFIKTNVPLSENVILDYVSENEEEPLPTMSNSENIIPNLRPSKQFDCTVTKPGPNQAESNEDIPLQHMPVNAVFTNKTPRKEMSRRRPKTIIKTLTSSDVAKKYDLLLDKRLEILNVQSAHMEVENHLKIKKLQLEIEILQNKKECQRKINKHTN